MKHTQEQLIHLANNNPQELIKYINNSYSNIEILTDSLEALCSECDNETIIIPVLIKLLKHINVSIRETAMIGISSFYGQQPKKLAPDIFNKLSDIASNDPSFLLKDYARDILVKHK